MGAFLAIKLFFGKALATAKGAWAALPPKVKMGLLIAVTALVAFLVHQHVAHKRIKAADTAGYARARAEDATALAQLKKRAQIAEANGIRIAQEVRTRNDTEARNINAGADALRLRGPGAASCRRIGNPAIPSAGSGHVKSDSATFAAPDPVLADDGLAAVPWDWLVNAGREADLDRAETLAWREWYAREAVEWEKLRKKP